jgi:hypothetical protein
MDENLIPGDDLDIDAIFAKAGKVKAGDCDCECCQPVPQSPKRLKLAYHEIMDALPARYRMQPGDLVTWKPGFRYRDAPHYEQPCIVIRLLEEPLVSEVTSPNGSIVLLETADIEVGLHNDEGDFMVFILDSRRLTHWLGDDHE